MIAFLRGIIEDIAQDYVVLDVGGVGYRVYASLDTLSRLPQAGGEVKLHTYMQVREDDVSLYGFLSKESLRLFQQIISVSGIGPKGGLSVLSVLTPEAFRFAVASGDVKAISKAPGIGKRTAERLILELKDKISPEEALAGLGKGSGTDGDGAPYASGEGGETSVMREVIEALVALGYTSAEAAKAIKSAEITEGMDTQEIMQRAFRYLL